MRLSTEVEQAKDVSLAARAINNRWPTTPEKRAGVVDEMYRIVKQRTHTIEVSTPDGLATAEVDNARNQIAAARNLIGIEAQNQADEHKAADIVMSAPPVMPTVLSRTPEQSQQLTAFLDVAGVPAEVKADA